MVISEIGMVCQAFFTVFSFWVILMAHINEFNFRSEAA